MGDAFKQYRRGDIVWLKEDLSSSKHVQKGKRPAIILQNNRGNTYSPTVIITYLTGNLKHKEMPTHVIIDNPCLEKKSMILLEQIKTCDKEMIISIKGHLSEEEMQKMDKALLTSLGVKAKEKEIIKEVIKEIVLEKEVVKEVIKEKEIPINFGGLELKQFEMQGQIGNYKIGETIHVDFKNQNNAILKTQIKTFIQELTHIQHAIKILKIKNEMENTLCS